MRTTLDINDTLMREAKRMAAKTGQTLTGIVEDALRERLAREKAGGQSSFKLRWPTVRGRLRPGVDVTDRDSLYERMEGRS
jgi:hypothetical protein